MEFPCQGIFVLVPGCTTLGLETPRDAELQYLREIPSLIWQSRKIGSCTEVTTQLEYAGHSPSDVTSNVYKLARQLVKVIFSGRFA
jgi:hypothetical protein